MDDIKVIDEFSRKVMGFKEEKIFDYDKVVDRYALLLNYYAKNLTHSELVDMDYYESLNYSFNYCTGYIIEEYLSDDLDTSKIDEMTSKNEHFNLILRSASKIVERLNNYKEEEMASVLGAYFYTIAKAVYDFENSKEIGISKVYS